MRRGVILVLASICFLFYKGEALFAGHSATFEAIAPLLPVVEAGQRTVFVIRITNTGTETWLNGEYSLFVKIYDVSKEYLTQSDKVTQFKDTEPTEALTGEISFDIPADYAGLYYYRINLELKDGRVVESRYFQLQILPPPPVPKPKLTGSVKSGYQASSTSESAANVNLYLVNKLPEKRYLKFTGIGTYTFAESPQLGNLLLYYRGKGANVSLGNVRDALSYLTLDRTEGLKVDTELGRFKLIATAGRKEQISSGTRPYVYGLGVAVKPTSWLDLGVNYADLMGKQNLSLTRDSPEGHSTNSITGLEASFTPSPEIMISAEYAHSIYDEDRLDDTPAQQGNGFQVNTSIYSEQLSLDTSYERAGKDFFFVGQVSPGGDYDEYDLSLDYFPLDYINTTFFYYQYQSGLSEKNEVFKITTGSGSLSLVFPTLPVLTISYDLDKTYSSEEGDELINDTSNIWSLGLSYPFKKMRFSISYLRSDYKSRIEPVVDEATASITYGIAIPWGRWVTLSPSYTTFEAQDSGDSAASDSRSMSLAIRYQLIPGKVIFSPEYKLTQTKTEKDRTATSLGLSYFLTKRSILQLRYDVTGRGTATNWKEKVSEQGNFSLDYTYEFDQNRRLVLKSIWMSSRNFETETSSEKSGLSFSYEYHF